VKRFLRILRAALSAFSLLLCFLVLVLWVRSYLVGDHFHQMRSQDRPDRLHWSIIHIEIGRGGIGFDRTVWSSPPAAFYPGLIRDQPLTYNRTAAEYPDLGRRSSTPPDELFMGFWFKPISSVTSNGAIVHAWKIVVPFWALVLLLFLMASPQLVHFYRRYRRRKPGLCPYCGYDLRASPDRCPECGTSIQRSSVLPTAG